MNLIVTSGYLTISPNSSSLQSQKKIIIFYFFFFFFLRNPFEQRFRYVLLFHSLKFTRSKVSLNFSKLFKPLENLEKFFKSLEKLSIISLRPLKNLKCRDTRKKWKRTKENRIWENEVWNELDIISIYRWKICNSLSSSNDIASKYWESRVTIIDWAPGMQSRKYKLTRSRVVDTPGESRFNTRTVFLDKVFCRL